MFSTQYKRAANEERNVKDHYEKIRFYHFRDLNDYSNQFNGVTVAVIVPRRGEVCVGTAICSKDDQFNKKRGRVIAQGRAEKKLYQGYIESVPLVLDTDDPKDMNNLAYGEAFTAVVEAFRMKPFRIRMKRRGR
jgi:hypothetical protein